MRIRVLAVSLLVTIPIFAQQLEILHKGDPVVVEGNEGNGSVIEGIASVNESAITGESAPVIREASGDRSAGTGGIAPPLARYESRLRRLAAEVKRDAFIVSQLVAAIGELNDFQKTIAIGKAGDRIAAAQKRANEDPAAPISTQQMLAFLQDPLIKHAREQGSMADTIEIRREILLRSAGIQSDLFHELDAARTERQALVALDQQLDGAMVEALSASFDIVRTGGK